MATEYDDFIELAHELINEFGAPITWQKKIVTLFDPAKPWLGGEEEIVSYSPVVCFVPDTGNEFDFIKLMSGTEVPKYTTFGLMAPQPFQPVITDLVEREGKPLVIDTINEIKPATQTVLYILGIV